MGATLNLSNRHLEADPTPSPPPRVTLRFGWKGKGPPPPSGLPSRSRSAHGRSDVSPELTGGPPENRPGYQYATSMRSRLPKVGNRGTLEGKVTKIDDSLEGFERITIKLDGYEFPITMVCETER